jgi:hypothetical protein
MVSFKRVSCLGELWRLGCQEVEVGGLLRLLMLLRMPCLHSSISANLYIVALCEAISCSRLTEGVVGEGGGTGGRNAPR